MLVICLDGSDLSRIQQYVIQHSTGYQILPFLLCGNKKQYLQLFKVLAQEPQSSESLSELCFRSPTSQMLLVLLVDTYFELRTLLVHLENLVVR